MTFIPEVHEGNPVILIRFKYNPLLVEEVKKLPGRRWSQALKCWYVPDTREYRARFGLPIKLPSKRKLEKVSPVNQPALDKLRELLILKGYSKNTQRTYYYEFAQFLYLLGSHNANDMDDERIRSYFLYCAEKLNMMESQINSRYNAIKFYFEQVLGRDKFFIGLPRPKAPSKLPKHISVRDIKKLFEAVANPKHALMLKLCYGMGLRVSEIVNLKVTDIDSGNMQVLIERGKGKKDRYVNLPESILDDLEMYCKEYRPVKYLIEGQGGGKYSIRSVQSVFTAAMRKANINKNVGIHGLRHSFATHLLENGTDISFIQQLLGHRDIKTTMIYAKVAQKNLKSVKSPLDKL
jgi:site-specific recombinase XerD